jgi:serine/threonine protein phosphatase PrpC
VTSLRAGAATDVGRVRTVNQDCFLVKDGLWAVADGMGGHAAGDVAARVAVETLRDAYSRGAGGDALVEAIRQANEAVWQRARSDSALRGMGTTLTALAAADGDGADSLVVANVGDSRAYLFERGELSQLTADHSLVEEMVRAGELSPHEAAGHPQRHIVTRALGIEPDIEVDTWIITPHPGDRFVVCSDGLSNEVAARDMVQVLREEPDAQAAADRLVEMAKAHGGTDNITVIVLDVSDDAGDQVGGGGGRTAGAGGNGAGIPDALAPDLTETGLPVISTRPPPSDEAPASALARASRTTFSTYRSPRRLTVRVLLFVVALLLILGGAAAFVVWYARASYYVGLQGTQLVIFQGRPGGVLWFKPTVAERTDVTTAEVPRRMLGQLDQGMSEPSRAAADDFVRNLVDEYQAENPTPTTTTSPAAGATTTTGPHP